VVRGAGGAGGPDLTRVGRERDEAWLKRFIRNPSAANVSSEMPPYDTLGPEDLDALVAYLRTLQ
jgi:cbb3-type cytochrome oxidase cytochrome c subunit